MRDYQAFFCAATQHPKPYDYQCRLACGDGASVSIPETLTTGSPCRSRLLNVPTGMGKTAAVTLAWLWNRVVRADETWPRRLVYCLPMRTLVEQTRDEITRWLDNLTLKSPDNEELAWLAIHSPVVLMGGEESDDLRREWDIHPEKPAILVGTQDMLISRALNRGYGMARARWPMHFALLNNDCLWVMDETQLMGAGLWTSAQLDWLRQNRFTTERPCMTWWMSATLGTSFLHTKDRVDNHLPEPGKVDIPDNEKAALPVLQAKRPVSNWKPTKVKDAKSRTAFLAALARGIRAGHASHTLSLVVCNNVRTAQELYGEMKADDVILLTSRFRPVDRKANVKRLLDFEAGRKDAVRKDSPCNHPGLICISTQVIEAGVDVSARMLWTELAPWPSHVQRLGRLNRDAKLNDEAQAFVFELPAEKGGTGPYELEDIKAARLILDGGNNAERLKAESLEPKPSPFPRAYDVHGLFSTEPDAFGGFTDVSPWVRGGDKNADVTVFWREWDAGKKSPNSSEFCGPAYCRDEGCPTAVHRVRDFLEKNTAFVWNSEEERWGKIAPRGLRPGMIVLLPANAGGYDAAVGWTGNAVDRVPDLPPPGPFCCEDEADKLTTAIGSWITLGDHLRAVAAETQRIAIKLALSDPLAASLVRAAELHDVGKSLPQWQDSLPMPRPDAAAIYAKAPVFAKRPGMRHEAASALALWRRYYLAANPDGHSALTIYLVAAHHGIVRTLLSSRRKSRQPNVCGIPITDPPPSLPWQDWPLDFACVQDGTDGVFNPDGTFTPVAPGWTALVADLLGGWEQYALQATSGAVPATEEPHALGPFRLAFLEAVLRAADAIASAGTTSMPKQESLP